MNVTFTCSSCRQPGRVEFEASDRSLVCASCQQELDLPAGAVVDGQLRRCLVCPSTDLYVRKDFPQRVGVGIVIVGFAISCFTWAHYWLITTFVILFATAFLDLLLYVIVGDALACYRCSAIYRGCLGHERHGAFQLETHERYRQQAARLAERGAVSQAPTAPH
jgi:hypothetical protein